jgi:hypothetical protein
MSHGDTRAMPSDRAVFDRLQRLSVILPAFAEEAASARRKVAELRCENARLVRRIAELQTEQVGTVRTTDVSAPSPRGGSGTTPM